MEIIRGGWTFCLELVQEGHVRPMALNSRSKVDPTIQHMTVKLASGCKGHVSLDLLDKASLQQQPLRALRMESYKNEHINFAMSV
jgi:hypothetical protein